MAGDQVLPKIKFNQNSNTIHVYKLQSALAPGSECSHSPDTFNFSWIFNVVSISQFILMRTLEHGGGGRLAEGLRGAQKKQNETEPVRPCRLSPPAPAV